MTKTGNTLNCIGTADRVDVSANAITLPNKVKINELECLTGNSKVKATNFEATTELVIGNFKFAYNNNKLTLTDHNGAECASWGV